MLMSIAVSAQCWHAFALVLPRISNPSKALQPHDKAPDPCSVVPFKQAMVLQHHKSNGWCQSSLCCACQGPQNPSITQRCVHSDIQSSVARFAGLAENLVS
jgi:hypothetical protein